MHFPHPTPPLLMAQEALHVWPLSTSYHLTLCSLSPNHTILDVPLSQALSCLEAFASAVTSTQGASWIFIQPVSFFSLRSQPKHDVFREALLFKIEAHPIKSNPSSSIFSNYIIPFYCVHSTYSTRKLTFKICVCLLPASFL